MHFVRKTASKLALLCLLTTVAQASPAHAGVLVQTRNARVEIDNNGNVSAQTIDTEPTGRQRVHSLPQQQLPPLPPAMPARPGEFSSAQCTESQIVTSSQSNQSTQQQTTTTIICQ